MDCDRAVPFKAGEFIKLQTTCRKVKQDGRNWKVCDETKNKNKKRRANFSLHD